MRLQKKCTVSLNVVNAVNLSGKLASFFPGKDSFPWLFLHSHCGSHTYRSLLTVGGGPLYK